MTPPPDAHVLNSPSWRKESIPSMITMTDRLTAHESADLVPSRPWWRQPFRTMVHEAFVLAVLLILMPRSK